ncbi:hypothetical protein E1301_Tti022895 [Triplophysa tibetana]|uniref:YqaJ viral recombinase domain-containing protein n=1 Tax=Triplophysa tibetana TaxID=1572043 RepID=A0A5A9P8A6_9TELE|nr:hypothetical protein E1301_Tti022895 [Triplophysa tibetana]
MEAHSVPSIVRSVGHNGSQAILDSMALTQEEQRDIQNATIGQRVNPQWHLFRRGRVTASNFGDVLLSNDVTAIVDRLLSNQPYTGGIPALDWGIENEHQAVQAFTTATQKEVQESGLWLSPSGVLGASPDGLVGSSEILEVKCPYNAREMTIDDAVKQKKISYISKEGDTYSLRRDHKYWHQVQGQLHLTGRQTCYFVVWTKKDHVIIPISRDDTWKPNLKSCHSPEPEEEPHTMEAHSVPKIIEYVNRQWSQAILARMVLSQEEQRAIQEATIGQCANPLWHLFRRGRVTASIFGDVLMSKVVTDDLPDRVLGNQPPTERNQAMKWGIDNECTAIQAFTTATQKEVQKSGLWLSASGVLGASPDGLVGSSEILEVKCPYNAREMTIDDALKKDEEKKDDDKKLIPYISKKGDTYSLGTEHKYWHQVQGQIHLTGRQTCYFVVWTKKDHVIIPISRDDTWKPNLKVLEDFFKTCVLPRLREM